MIGLSGAHRSGKTTLAKAFAEKHDVIFIPSQISKIVVDMGYDQKTDYDLNTRLKIQCRVLEAAEENYKAVKTPFVTDRTPIDFIAYALCDAGREGITPKQNAELHNFIERCYQVASRYFKVIIFVPPTIKFAVEADKPPESFGYQEHISTLIQGAIFDERLRCDVDRIYRSETSMDARMENIEFIYNDVMFGLEKDAKQATLQ